MQSPLARVQFLQSSEIAVNLRATIGLTESMKSGSLTHPKRFGVIPARDAGLGANMRNLGGTS
jgi:hypothetical protein